MQTDHAIYLTKRFDSRKTKILMRQTMEKSENKMTISPFRSNLPKLFIVPSSGILIKL